MNDKKNILVFIGATYFFGAEKVTLDVLKGFKNCGYNIHCIVSGWNNGDFIGRIQKLGINYTPIKLGWYYITKFFWSLDSLIHFPKAVLDFLKIKKQFKPQLFYTISYRQLVLLYPFIPASSVVYNVQEPNSNSKLSSFLIKLIDSKVIYYIACSNFIKEDLIKCGLSSSKIYVIHNGIEIVEKNNIIKNEILTLGIVGQVIPRKGHRVVIEALNHLKQKGVIVNLRIVGNGNIEFTNEISNLIHKYNLDNQVTWAGFVKSYQDIYKGIDVLIAPTQNEEPFGLMAAEANMFGIPVITSNKGGLAEIIQNNINGFTFNSNNPIELAEKILLLYNDPNLIKYFGEAGKQIVRNQFSIDIMSNKINQLIEQI